MNEFELIDKYFAPAGRLRSDVAVGIGDDAAVLIPPPGRRLAVTADVLVAGVHFSGCADPEDIGHKALAVNLSDLAAMGAEPAWVTMMLTLPEADAVWLEKFSRGFLSLAEKYGVQLVGGDTTRGPLAIGVQLAGFVPENEFLLRSGARPGDDIYVTGEIGDAALALAALQGRITLGGDAMNRVRAKLDRPQARVREGIYLRGIASAAIDVSDGLLADLGHIAFRSGVRAVIECAGVPLSPVLQAVLGQEFTLLDALTGGDDYELCFTAAVKHRGELERAFGEMGTRCTRIGYIAAGVGVHCITPDGRSWEPPVSGYRHFV